MANLGPRVIGKEQKFAKCPNEKHKGFWARYVPHRQAQKTRTINQVRPRLKYPGHAAHKLPTCQKPRIPISTCQKPNFNYPSSTPLNRSSIQRYPSKRQPKMQFFKSFTTAAAHTSNKTGPIAALLKSRSVIRFAGPDTIKFLQGLLTNDVRRFADPPAERTSTVPTPNLASVSEPPMYAALLTPQGRFLYDFFLYKPPRDAYRLVRTGSGPGSDSNGGGSVELLADVDSSVLDELLQTLKRYRLRAKVEIENVGEDFSCWQRFGGDLGKKSREVEEPEAASVGWGSGVDHAAISASRGNDLGWQWFKDPRLDCLGFRGIFPTDKTPPLVEADKETDERNYLLWRIEKGIAEGSTETPKGEAIPLEYNLAGLNAISFDKGCYVGQELVARTHHRGVIRKRLLPLKFVDGNGKEVEKKVAPGAEVIDTASGKKVGSVTTALGCRGMGPLRLDDAFKGSGPLAIQGVEDVKVEAIRPKWWPDEWFPDHQQHSAVA